MSLLSHILVMEAVALTPIHIGVPMEERWQRDWDFAPDPDGRPLLYRLDLNRLLALLPEESLRGLTEPPARRLHPDQWARARLSQHRFHGDTVPGEVLPLIRDTAGRPYLPGSTLKGALRTAVLYARVGNATLGPGELHRGPDGRPRRQTAAQGIEERYLRPPAQRARGLTGANYDLMRVVRLTDASLRAGSTDVAPAIWAGRGNSQGRRLTWLEVFTPGSRFVFNITLDRRLAEEEGPRPSQLDRRPLQVGLSWPQDARAIAQMAQLARWCREWSRAVLVGQRRLASAMGEPLRAQVLSALDQVEERLEKTPQAGFLLPIGWGTGWHGKTLHNRLSDQALREARVRLPYGLRMALFNGKQTPLGWLEVHPRKNPT